MKKLIFGLFCLFSFSLVYSITYAQSADDVLGSILKGSGSNNVSRGYVPADKDAIKVISFSDKTLVLEAPLAQKTNQPVSNYYITWGPISYKEITTTDSSELLQKIQDSDNYQKIANKSVYEIKNGKLLLSLPLVETVGDLYVTIAPIDSTSSNGNMIEDYKINLSSQSVGSKVLAESFSNSSSDQAIANVSCLRDKSANRVNFTWSVNSSLNASKVEIYHRGDTDQGDMTLKGTVAIGDKTFTMNTPHRKGQMFRFKPLSSDGAPIGKEIQYLCRPADDSTPSVIDDSKNSNSNSTTPGIVVVPATGPKETFAFVIFAASLVYVVYKRMRTA